MKYYKHYTNLVETVKLIIDEKEYYPILDSEDPDDKGVAYNYKFNHKILETFCIEYLKYFETDYFFGCSFQVYDNTYNKRLNSFKNSYIDATELDFIKSELDEGVFGYKFDSFITFPFPFPLDMMLKDLIETYEEYRKQIYYSLKKRLEYLQQRAESLGFELTSDTKRDSYLKITFDRYNLEPIREKVQVKQEEPLIDYSDSKLTEKIIALNEIGVLDFLKQKEPFNMSTNKIAEFLSLCIGEKTRSIQSYINPIINNSDQTKSPYNTVKTVKGVKQKLIQIGCIIE